MEPVDPNMPVRDGWNTVTWAKDQPEYRPLPALTEDGPYGRVISRWALSHRERELVAAGGDIYLELMTFHKPLQPIIVGVFYPQAQKVTWWDRLTEWWRRWRQPIVAYGFGVPTPDVRDVRGNVIPRIATGQ